ncbi:MAG TPA: transcriptional regulator [Mycobacteriales bacterium]
MEQGRERDQVGAVAALNHSLSRRAYDLVCSRGWTSRDDAAAALGVDRTVAAFHLDKLLAAGLLTVRYERTSGRTGPGAGRPAKLYARSATDVDVSFPPRRYDLASALLADALDRTAAGQDARQALGDVAHDTGVQLGREAAVSRGRTSPRTALVRTLTDTGYAPRQHGRDIELANCPFHRLVAGHPDLVCRMNLDLLAGVLEGLQCDGTLCARLEPGEGRCCVRIGPVARQS